MTEFGEVIWSPPANAQANTRIGAYLRWLRETQGLSIDDYWALWRWSTTDLAGFWATVWDYFGTGERSDRVLVGERMPDVEWFPDQNVNYAQRLLAAVRDDAPAILGRSQTREPVEWTGADLKDAVGRCRAGLVRLGVGRGDRVAAYLPNIPETVVLLLASASLGAVFSSCAPEFGARSVIDRWSQIEPRVLVAVDGYRYGAKEVPRRAEVAEIARALPSVEHVVSLPYLERRVSEGGTSERSREAADVPDTIEWSTLLGEPGELVFEQLPFAHPLYVLYSSGTTGLPKPIIHGHGGILLEHSKTLALGFDIGPGDRFFWFTSTGWMMWNVLVSALAVGSAIVVYDGNPGYPDLDELWRVASETSMTFFGTSAAFLLACRKAGLRPGASFDLTSLRGLGSTGSPLPPEGFEWVYESINSDLLLQSYSGGTDLCTGFVGGSPLLPVYAGELACPSLGAAVAAYDPTGSPVVGELGELVLEQPMPSMPVGFWGDEDGSRYRAAYFDDFPGVWRHGDWLTITERGSYVITGRSDATLKRGGVRLGTAEFYSIVDSFDDVVDSLVVHLEGGDELLLFVVLGSGVELSDEMRSRIGSALRTSLSPRHVPDRIVQVASVPRTLSGKKLEVPIKRILTGTPVDVAVSKGALANPESIDAFVAFARNG